MLQFEYLKYSKLTENIVVAMQNLHVRHKLNSWPLKVKGFFPYTNYHTTSLGRNVLSCLLMFE